MSMIRVASSYPFAKFLAGEVIAFFLGGSLIGDRWRFLHLAQSFPNSFKFVFFRRFASIKCKHEIVKKVGKSAARRGIHATHNCSSAIPGKKLKLHSTWSGW